MTEECREHIRVCAYADVCSGEGEKPPFVGAESGFDEDC